MLVGQQVNIAIIYHLQLDQKIVSEWLVGGFKPSEQYESQLGIFFPIYGKIKFMFQTTNQTMYSHLQYHHL